MVLVNSFWLILLYPWGHLTQRQLVYLLLALFLWFRDSGPLVFGMSVDCDLLVY